MEGLASGYIARCMPTLAHFDPAMKDRTGQQSAGRRPQSQGSRRLSELLSTRPTRGLRSMLVGSFSLFLYCSKDYLRRNGKPRSRVDLSRARFRRVHRRSARDRCCPMAGRGDRVATVSASKAIACSPNAMRPAQGMGIVLLPTFVASAGWMGSSASSATRSRSAARCGHRCEPSMGILAASRP